MCFPDSNDGQAQAARSKDKLKRQEAKRERQITKGNENIDRAFAGFDDAYYNQFQNDYTGYYFPQLEDQYGKARGHTTASLFERGLGESTVGSATLGDLFKAYTDKRADIANQGVDAANQIKSNVEKTKTDLYTLNQASADPKGINARALGEASTLVAPTAFSPLGNVFASALDPVVAAAAARGRSPGTPYSSPYRYASGSGSGSVVT